MEVTWTDKSTLTRRRKDIYVLAVLKVNTWWNTRQDCRESSHDMNFNQLLMSTSAVQWSTQEGHELPQKLGAHVSTNYQLHMCAPHLHMNTQNCMPIQCSCCCAPPHLSWSASGLLLSSTSPPRSSSMLLYMNIPLFPASALNVTTECALLMQISWMYVICWRQTCYLCMYGSILSPNHYVHIQPICSIKLARQEMKLSRSSIRKTICMLSLFIYILFSTSTHFATSVSQSSCYFSEF